MPRLGALIMQNFALPPQASPCRARCPSGGTAQTSFHETRAERGARTRICAAHASPTARRGRAPRYVTSSSNLALRRIGESRVARAPCGCNLSSQRRLQAFAAFWGLNRKVLSNFQARWMTDTCEPNYLRPPNATLALQRLSSAWLVAPTDQLAGLKTCILRHANGSHARHVAWGTDVAAGLRELWLASAKAQAESVARFLAPMRRNGTALMRSIVAATRLDHQLYMRAAATYSRRCDAWRRVEDWARPHTHSF